MARRRLLSDAEILARARPLFVERGYVVRTREISAAVGLTWGAIALRFGTKRALFQQAMAAVAGPAHEPAEHTDLVGLLEQTRAHLRERWPQRLQLRMAAAPAGPDGEEEQMARRLTTALGMGSRGGSIRSDIEAEALARLALALLTGEVAQRFVAGEQAPVADRSVIDSMVALMSQG